MEEEAVDSGTLLISGGEVLAVVGALHVARPELDVAAGAGGRAAHPEQDRGGRDDDSEREKAIIDADPADGPLRHATPAIAANFAKVRTLRLVPGDPQTLSMTVDVSFAVPDPSVKWKQRALPAAFTLSR